jgi:hypothetical protein
MRVWTKSLVWKLLVTAGWFLEVPPLIVLALAVAVGADTRPGVPPKDAWTCPVTHPIKGNFTTYSGERCIYHVPGGQFYGKTKPERCFATEEEARRDGCRKSKR